jgi:type VI secretion system protein ImpF
LTWIVQVEIYNIECSRSGRQENAMPSTPNQPLLPSFLDQLLDDEPGVQREAQPGRHQVLSQMKRSVNRDLENLLNTRRRFLSAPLDLPELQQSLVRYGLPDFTGRAMSSAEAREEFRLTLENILRACEPRFKTVSVTLLDAAEPLYRTLRFRIDALMHADPAPEELVFDSSLEPLTGTFKIERAGR